MADSRIKDLAGTLTNSTVSTSDYVAIDDVTVGEAAKKMTVANLKLTMLQGFTASRAIGTDAGGNIGVSSTTVTELATIHGVTAGVATAGKAAVLDSHKAIDAVRTAALYLGVSGAEVEVTATAAALNTVDGAKGHVRGLQQGLSIPGGTSIIGDVTLTYTQAGHHAAGLSGANITVTLPALSTCGRSAPFAFSVDANTGGDDLIIIDNGADGGFGDGATTGTQIALSTVGAYVLLRAPGVAGGKWAVCGGWGYTIS